jgi:hypothetical protein
MSGTNDFGVELFRILNEGSLKIDNIIICPPAMMAAVECINNNLNRGVEGGATRDRPGSPQQQQQGGRNGIQSSASRRISRNQSRSTSPNTGARNNGNANVNAQTSGQQSWNQPGQQGGPQGTPQGQQQGYQGGQQQGYQGGQQQGYQGQQGGQQQGYQGQQGGQQQGYQGQQGGQQQGGAQGYYQNQQQQGGQQRGGQQQGGQQQGGQQRGGQQQQQRGGGGQQQSQGGSTDYIIDVKRGEECFYCNCPDMHLVNALFLDSVFDITSEDIASIKGEDPFLHVAPMVANNGMYSKKLVDGVISARTDGVIKDSIAPETITTQTKSLLVNACDFLGLWLDKFPYELSMRFFPLYDDEIGQKMVRMIQLDAELGLYLEDNDLDAKGVSIFFRGRRFSLNILLPNSPKGLPEMITKLNAGAFESMMGGLEPRPVTLSMPPFLLNQSRCLDDELKQMGMDDIYGEEPKPRSMMSDDEINNEQPPSNIKPNRIVHRAFLLINQHGAEARDTLKFDDRRPKIDIESRLPRFNVDHPFVFFVWDHTTSTIVMLGSVINPVQDTV